MRAAKGKLSRKRVAVYQENLIKTSRRGDFAHSLQTPALESSLECVKKKKKSFLNIKPKKPIHEQLSVSQEASQYFHQVQDLGLITMGWIFVQEEKENRIS